MSKENNIHFEKLTPVNDCELGIYKNAMDFVFSEKDILNVAITGPYASGKSSMLESYKKINNDKKFINISLAHFNDNKSNDNNTEEIKNETNDKGKRDVKQNFIDENRLEGKIINQLIHKINPSDIPQTNFNIKKKIETKEIVKRTALSSIFSILFLYIMFFKYWYITVSEGFFKFAFSWTLNSGVLILGGIICSTIVIYYIYKLIESQKFSKCLKKLKMQGYEIEVFGDNDESYFDKYLNEVLYLFKNSNADAIVFEDIDRYNSALIFEKLREINVLVNSESKKSIKFIYLLKDDMFISKDRTKFFDYIIPIIPVVDSSNSYDQFIDHFKKGNLYNLLDKNFLKDISLYVDDMRLLKNIYNEFCVYNSKLEQENSKQNENERFKLDNNKLLGMIVYKNVFPKDFSELQLGQGYVYCILNSKEDIIANEVKKLESEIESLEIENDSIKDEELNSIDELDACYFVYNRQLEVNGKEEEAFKNKVEFIRAIKDNKYNCKQYNEWARNWNQCDVKPIFEKIRNSEFYKKRLKLIEQKNINKIEENKKRINKYQTIINDLQGKYIKDLINRENVKEIFKKDYINETGDKEEFKEIKSSNYFPLIKYLIRNGYIDENYSDYMTYFYPNSLTYSDKSFLLSIANKKAKKYSYELENCKLILSRLKLSDFNEEEVLNFDLLCSILKDYSSYKEQLEKLFDNIIENKYACFIKDFMESAKDEDKKISFVKQFNKYWNDACYWLTSEDKFDSNIKRKYIQYTMMFSNTEDIEKNNKEHEIEHGIGDDVIYSQLLFPIKDYINSDNEFLNMECNNVKTFIENLSLIQTQFKDINYSKSNKELFREVYRNDLYEINYKMISLILNKIYEINESNDYKEKNYSLIMSKPEESLAIYINKNIDNYINVILEEHPNRIVDELKDSLVIINNDNLKSDLKDNYIDLLETIIEKLEDIKNDELLEKIMKKGIVKNTSDNLLNYYFRKEKVMDDILIDFINNFTEDLYVEYDSIDQAYEEGAASSFFKSVIITNELADDKYKEILQNFNRYYKSFSFNSIDKNKISILIKLKIIRMNQDTLDFIRKNYKENIKEYILYYIDDYLEVALSDEYFDYDEMIEILDEDIEEDKKIKLIEYTNKSISIENKNYSEKVKEYILNNNFDTNDIKYIIDNFDYYIGSLKNIVMEKVVENIDKIIDKKYSMSYKLIRELLEREILEKDTVKEILSISMPRLNKDEVITCFEKMKMNKYLSLINKEEGRIQYTPINERLLIALQNEEFISGFNSENIDEEGYYNIEKELVNK